MVVSLYHLGFRSGGGLPPFWFEGIRTFLEDLTILKYIGLSVHRCATCDPNSYITQCFKCYQYNYTAKHYRSVARCGFCSAAGHSSQDCSKKDDRTAFHCIPCRKAGHVSWARECPIRKRQVEKAQQAYACRPSKFQVRATSPKPASTATSATTGSTRREASPTRAIPRDPSPESIIEVEMPDQETESEPELEPEPLAPSKALVRPRKRARPAEVTTDSDSDFPGPHGFIPVRNRRSKASQQSKTT